MTILPSTIFPARLEILHLVSGVYSILHIPSGERYAGGAERCLKNRYSYFRAKLGLRTHGHNSRRGTSVDSKLQELWNAGQPADFLFEVVELCPPEQVRERELYWWIKLDCTLGRPPRGYVLDKKVRAKMSTGRAEYLKTPGARASLAERAKKQHRNKNFGHWTWVDVPGYNSRENI